MPYRNVARTGFARAPLQAASALRSAIAARAGGGGAFVELRLRVLVCLLSVFSRALDAILAIGSNPMVILVTRHAVLVDLYTLLVAALYISHLRQLTVINFIY